MRLDYLETFYWVGTLKSFADTAVKLNIAQPTVSHRINTLEDELNTELLERRARRVVLTAAGARLERSAHAPADSRRQLGHAHERARGKSRPGQRRDLPARHAADFLRYCQRNPKPCPVLAVSDPGDPHLPELGLDIDIRTDVPRYRIWRNGELGAEVSDIRSLCITHAPGAMLITDRQNHELANY